MLGELLGEPFARRGVNWATGPRCTGSAQRLQWCWAHLKRDFQALIDSEDHQVKRLGHDLMRPTRELFRHWARYRDGTLTRRGFQRLMKPIRQEIEACCCAVRSAAMRDSTACAPL